MLVFCWFRGSYGYEAELRQWSRVYRALPAVEPRDFDGDVQPAGDEAVWVKWFGDRLAVLNDSSAERQVELGIPRPARPVGEVFDATTCRPLQFAADGQRLRVSLQLRAWDLRSLILRPE